MLLNPVQSRYSNCIFNLIDDGLSMAQVDVCSVDAILPQTQCEQCTYKGCLPYARAIVEEGETIDKCVPGGERVLEELGRLLGQEVEPLREGVKRRLKPPYTAKIREEECIGCTKCIESLPGGCNYWVFKKNAHSSDGCLQWM